MINKNLAMSPWFLAGFTDAEGCFRISILKNKNYKSTQSLVSTENVKSNLTSLPWSVRLYFQIELHKKDEAILELAQSTLGVGKIYKARQETSMLQVSSFKDMPAVLDFFDKYPLITQKLADYILFKQAYEMIKNKEHLTLEGLSKLVGVKASLNNGLPAQLKEAYPDVEPINRLKVVNKEIPDPNWLAGFTSGEGSFSVGVHPSTHHKLGYQVRLKFQITQHDRDQELMESIVKYFNCGIISIRKDIVDLHVHKFPEICEKIIPFFTKYPILGVKNQNFEDFCQVAELIKEKAHLNQAGLEEIRKIKDGMNSQRED